MVMKSPLCSIKGLMVPDCCSGLGLLGSFSSFFANPVIQKPCWLLAQCKSKFRNNDLLHLRYFLWYMAKIPVVLCILYRSSFHENGNDHCICWVYSGAWSVILKLLEIADSHFSKSCFLVSLSPSLSHHIHTLSLPHSVFKTASSFIHIKCKIHSGAQHVGQRKARQELGIQAAEIR